ncbi:hypothetical protein G6O67_007373 [Ophiocordyceps sinensis]|uniref:Uncharacterized protein n=1 Tax=Ophiocordyceps sinensis TaxID=72228 RepID=A0A8H4PLJ3_9HYPO|nr:hypothetical protein G6O67_007373 [Ophiocordyceps sinensis]
MAQFLTVSPEASKKGRSRFSKALPPVPGLVSRESKQLPLLPSLAVSPRPPKPPAKEKEKEKEQTDDGSVRTVKSGIARKPVGIVEFASSSPPPKLKPLSAEAPPTDDGVAAAPSLLLGTLQPWARPFRYAGPPSPTDSLSSLLSAYSRIPDEPRDRNHQCI